MTVDFENETNTTTDIITNYSGKITWWPKFLTTFDNFWSRGSNLATQDSFANSNIFWRTILITDINPSFKFSQSRLKGISRELSFDDDKDTLSVSSRSGPGAASKSRSTTYISGAGSQNSSNNVKHQDAKKSVPPSPAIKKKVFFKKDLK